VCLRVFLCASTIPVCCAVLTHTHATRVVSDDMDMGEGGVDRTEETAADATVAEGEQQMVDKASQIKMQQGKDDNVQQDIAHGNGKQYDEDAANRKFTYNTAQGDHPLLPPPLSTSSLSRLFRLLCCVYVPLSLLR